MLDWSNILQQLIWIDYLIIVVLGYCIVKGFFNGLVKEVVGLLSWLLAFLVGAYAAPAVSGSLGFIESPSMRWVVGFMLCFALVLIVGKLVVNSSAVALRSIGLSSTNKILGGGFGFLKGFLIMSIIFSLVGVGKSTDDAKWKDSFFLSGTGPLTTWLLSFIPQNFPQEKIKRIGADAGNKVKEALKHSYESVAIAPTNNEDKE